MIELDIRGFLFLIAVVPRFADATSVYVRLAKHRGGDIAPANAVLTVVIRPSRPTSPQGITSPALAALTRRKVRDSARRAVVRFVALSEPRSITHPGESGLVRNLIRWDSHDMT